MMLFSTTLALAENAVLPPPTVNKPAIHSTDDTASVEESAPNLSQELKAPGVDSNVDVRSHKDKDGATITEYSMNGQIYQIKVQPAGGFPAYYLYRNKAGHFERRRPGGQPAIIPPTWILKSF